MKTLLEILGMFISKVIDSIQNNGVVKKELTVKYITFIELSAHCIVREFQRISVVPDLEDIFSKYIKIDQSICTSACDKIVQLLKKQDAINVEASDELSTLVEQLRVKLEDHLICLSSLYPNHYDSEMHVPTGLAQRLMQPIADDFNLLKLNFLSRETSQLLKIIGNEINVVTEGEILVTYKLINYLRELVTDLSKIKAGEGVRDEIFDFLILRNFNNVSFLLFNKITIQEKLGALENEEQRYHYLQSVSKHYSTLAFKEVEGYDSDSISVIEYVNNLISHEISYLKDIRQTELPVNETDPERAGESGKIVTTMNVALQAAFLRVLVNAGVYKDIVVKDLLRFCSKNFRTVKQETLDVESLRTKYYAIDENTKSSLIAFCRRLLEKSRDID